MLRTLEPFKELTDLQGRLNKVFESVLPSTSQKDMGNWVPAVDVYETENSVEIEMEAPGIDEKDLKVKLEDSTLTISGERNYEKKEEKHNYYRMERSYGSFKRSFLLPDNVDKDAIKAKYENGILKVSIPKKAESKAKEISIGK